VADVGVSGVKAVTSVAADWIKSNYSVVIFVLLFSKIILPILTPLLSFVLYHINMTLAIAFSPWISQTAFNIVMYFFAGTLYLRVAIFLHSLLRG